nr:nitroreductase [Eudoraea chungangensis]
MVIDLIRERRSVFPDSYSSEKISKEELEILLEAANWAPTHKRTEPWRFKVLRGKSLEKLGAFLAAKYVEVVEKPKQFKINKLKENPTKAGAIIAICMQRDEKEQLPEWEEIAATAMAVQNMWLCCVEMGLGAYWSSPRLISYMDEFFDLNKGEKCLGFFYVGKYSSPIPAIERGSIEEKTVWL